MKTQNKVLGIGIALGALAAGSFDANASTNHPPAFSNGYMTNTVLAGTVSNIVLGNATDFDGDNVNYIIQNIPAVGKLESLVFNGSNQLYSVNANFHGMDCIPVYAADGLSTTFGYSYINVLPNNKPAVITGSKMEGNTFSVNADVQPNRINVLEKTHDFSNFDSVDSKFIAYSTNAFKSAVFTDVNATNSSGFYRIRTVSP